MTLSTSAGPWPITCERQIHEGRFALRFEPDRLQRNQQPRGFAADRQRLPEAFLAAYPTLCLNAATRLRTLYDPVDDPPEEERLACPGGGRTLRRRRD